jgi:energy-coupling factor transporter ATP-binding protein EcfA2
MIVRRNTNLRKPPNEKTNAEGVTMPLHNSTPWGSQWRKWDLHVHTPESVLNNGFGDDWDVYVTKLFKKAIEKDIVGIGITDYYLIDGYKKLREDYLSNQTKLKSLFSDGEIQRIQEMLVVPNIEFRIDKLVVEEKEFKWNRKVNYHLILSDKLPISKIENLISDINFEGLVVDRRVQKKRLTRANLAELGTELQKYQKEFSGKDPVFVGMMCAAVDPDQIQEVLDNNLDVSKENYFFGLPADEDLSGVDWASGGHLERKNLLKKCHFVLSGNPNTYQFCLGQKHNSEEEYLAEFEQTKPCIWGSDAHDFDRLFEPDKNRYTWIKAAPTFEGLRQVLFEPRDRVKIQENIPTEKVPYRVIDRVRFLDSPPGQRFTSEWIRFNENLTVIIGGKSSGKSLLLQHMAEAIDPEQVRERCGEDWVDYRSLTGEIDFEVVWKSKNIDKISDAEKQGQITFIPQLYVNRLAEKEGQAQLKELIQAILSQNDEFKKFYEESEEKRREESEEIRNQIYSLLDLRSKYGLINGEAKLLGTSQQIDGEILRLTSEIEQLRSSSGFDEKDLKIYQQLDASLAKKKEELADKNALRQISATFLTKVATRKTNVLNQIESEFIQLGQLPAASIDIEALKESLKGEIAQAFDNFNEKAGKNLLELDRQLASITVHIEKLEKDLVPYHTKTVNQELLRRRSSDLQIQITKRAELERKTKDLANLKNLGKAAKVALYEAYSQLFSIYKDRVALLGKPTYTKIGDELLLHAKLSFNRQRFYDAFTSLFDLRGRIKTVFPDRFDDNDQFIYAAEQHVGNIRSISENLPKVEDEDGLMVKSSTSRQDLFERLFDDYFEIDYTIEHRGDDILRMSPGKRGVVLLQLILHLSSADHPILIDQPEDNLDNRTIYNELNGFIREKKEKRQIIIVTHNANLAVSTDAENVIVANQSGQQRGRDKREFQFEYISGPLENTFRDDTQSGILYQMGIREHVCDILEGGEEAFRQREQKYGFA